jgi:hypothetical protein
MAGRTCSPPASCLSPATPTFTRSVNVAAIGYAWLIRVGLQFDVAIDNPNRPVDAARPPKTHKVKLTLVAEINPELVSDPPFANARADVTVGCCPVFLKASSPTITLCSLLSL